MTLRANMAGCIAMLGIVGWRRIWYRIYYVYKFSKYDISKSWCQDRLPGAYHKKEIFPFLLFCSLQWFLSSILRSLSLWTLPCKSCGQNRGHSDVFWSVWQASPSWRDLSWAHFRLFWYSRCPVVRTKSCSKHRCMPVLVLKKVWFAPSLTPSPSTDTLWQRF